MKIQLFKDVNKKWRVRIVASNGKILMSSEAYSSRAKAIQTAHNIYHDPIHWDKNNDK